MSMEAITNFLFENRCKKLSVHCVGDAMIDEYYNVNVNRISPEFPMPIMLSEDDKPICRPGGAANVAYQLRHFNAWVELICNLDHRAFDLFKEHDVSYTYSATMARDKKLPIKRRFLDNGIQVKRWDIEVKGHGVSEKDYKFSMDYCIDQYKRMAPLADIAILSDYDKGFFSDYYAHLWTTTLKQRGTKTIVDPKKGPINKWKFCTVFKPNAAEARELSGLTDHHAQCRFFKQTLDCEHVIITKSGEGLAGIWGKEYFEYTPEDKVYAESVIGAGDCFDAILALALGHGIHVVEAAQIAFEAGKIYVQNKMNRPIVPAELSKTRIVHPDDLASRDFKLVFTNGCFDILHAGHLQTLEFAKAKGDKLVVAINSDESVKQLKGDNRPIIPEDQRAKILASLRMVDFVVIFNELTPIEAIQKCEPDVLVKGGDYEIENIVGANVVKEVYTCPVVEGVSTTDLLRAANYYPLPKTMPSI